MDQTIQMIQEEALSDFDLTFFQVNHNRFNILARKKATCYVGWKTFADYRVFSRPIALWPPSGIIIHKRNQIKFGPKGTLLSLRELLKDKTLTLGVIDAFAYSPEIQALLSEYRDASQVFPIRTSSMQVNIKTLAANRFDYIIGWPSQPVVHERINHAPNDFIFYNLKEDQKYLYIGVSCSNCETGRDIIARVNTLFEKKDALNRVMSFMKQWVIMSEQHETLYNETIFLGKKHPNVVHMIYP